MPRPSRDLTDEKFGRWTAKYKLKKDGRTFWHCVCDCGVERDVNYSALVCGRSKSCGCLGLENATKAKIKDISGQRFGRLVAIKRTGKMIRTNSEWECICDCGKTCYVNINSLTQDKTKSCGCLAKEHKENFGKNNYQIKGHGIHDLSGQKFGKLTVIKDSGLRTKTGNVLWSCQCECGNIKNIAGSHLLNGDTNSCGCINSKGELKIQQILKKNNINYIQQFQFKDCVNTLTGYKLYFDFYLPDYNCCIEYDGEQHFKSRKQGYFTEDKVEEIKQRDRIKDKYCKDNNIELIRIPYTKINQINIDMLLPKSKGGDKE